jgi:hypothetical protein
LKSGKAFLVFDGRELRPYPDAQTAIAAIARAKGACSAVDISAIRQDEAAPQKQMCE